MSYIQIFWPALRSWVSPLNFLSLDFLILNNNNKTHTQKQNLYTKLKFRLEMLYKLESTRYYYYCSLILNN